MRCSRRGASANRARRWVLKCGLLGSRGGPGPCRGLGEIVLSPLQDQVRWPRFTGPGPCGARAAGHQPIVPAGGCLTVGSWGAAEGLVPAWGLEKMF